MKQPNLQDQARQIFLSALQAVDARAATKRAVHLHDSELTIRDTKLNIAGRPIYVVAIGKAATTMAAGLNDVLGKCVTKGIICGPPGQEFQPAGWRIYSGGHPLPNDESIAGARAAVQLLSNAEENGLVIFLISGGGSAMFELPVSEEITLDDLREANRQLVVSGAAIAEINAVRRAYSAVKGGQLASAAPRCNQISLIISDTNPRDAGNVASGPSLEPDADAPLVTEVVSRYGLEAKLPGSIMRALGRYVPHVAGSGGRIRAHYVLLNNTAALAAAALEAQQLGFAVEIATDIIEQDIEAGCELLLERAEKLWRQNPYAAVCLLSGGEFSCAVQGEGIGGRNLETVLRCSRKIAERDFAPHWAVLSAGTDGVDGNSPVAGAVADETTLSKAKSKRVDAADCLARSDSFSFFGEEDLVSTGPTGTNVRDVRIVLIRARG